MNINHDPIFISEEVEKFYTEKDGVEVKYVCTTALRNDTVPVDVFYRATPHPEFGNHYFGLYPNPFNEGLLICNADAVEDYEFGMVEHNGVWFYSTHRHDYRPVGINEGAIDGGRAYIRVVGDLVPHTYKVKNGKFKEENND
jgi:hypothetical protein